MLFNSYGFIFLFLPLVLLGFFLLARSSHIFAAGWLAAASLFFYGYWNPAYVALLSISIICNYLLGLWIVRARNQGAANQESRNSKLLFVLAIAANLALLAYYKYANFFITNVNSVADTQ